MLSFSLIRFEAAKVRKISEGDVLIKVKKII